MRNFLRVGVAAMSTLVRYLASLVLLCEQRYSRGIADSLLQLGGGHMSRANAVGATHPTPQGAQGQPPGRAPCPPSAKG